MSVPRTSAVWPPNEALTQQPLVAGTTLVARGTGGADSITYPRDTPSTVTSLMLSEAFLAEKPPIDEAKLLYLINIVCRGVIQELTVDPKALAPADIEAMFSVLAGGA